MPSFGGEAKPSVPCRRFAACKRFLNLRGSRNLGKITRTVSRPQFHLLPLASLASLRMYRHLAAKVGTSKGGGKAMANYPQGLAQDAVCQSHTSHMTGLWFLPTQPLRLNTNEWMEDELQLYQLLMMGVNTRNMLSCLQKYNKLNKSHLVWQLLNTFQQVFFLVYYYKIWVLNLLSTFIYVCLNGKDPNHTFQFVVYCFYW